MAKEIATKMTQEHEDWTWRWSEHVKKTLIQPKVEEIIEVNLEKLIDVNVTIVRKSGNILQHTESTFSVRHSSEYETSDNDRKVSFIVWRVSDEKSAFNMLKECFRFFVQQWNSVALADYSDVNVTDKVERLKYLRNKMRLVN